MCSIADQRAGAQEVVKPLLYLIKQQQQQQQRE